MEKLFRFRYVLPIVLVIGILGVTAYQVEGDKAKVAALQSTLESRVATSAKNQQNNPAIPPPPPGVLAYSTGIGRCSGSLGMTPFGPVIMTAAHCFQGLGAGTDMNITYPEPRKVSKNTPGTSIIGDIITIPTTSSTKDLPKTCNKPLKEGDMAQAWTFPGAASENREVRVLYYVTGPVRRSSSNDTAILGALAPGSSGGGVYGKDDDGNLCLAGTISRADVCSGELCAIFEQGKFSNKK